MLRHLRFNTVYCVLAVVLLAIEVMIALFCHDTVVRPYVGDFLVVLLIYCWVRSFLNTPVLPTAIAVLLFSYAVETAQYFNIVQVLGLQQSKLARIIIGSSFEWIDMLMYSCGFIVVLLCEYSGPKKRNTW